MELNDSNFNSIINSGKIILVDFWSNSCGPCRAIMPIIDEAIRSYAGNTKVIIGKLNTAQNNIYTQYGVRTVPTILIFKNGQVVDRLLLPVTYNSIISKINSHL